MNSLSTKTVEIASLVSSSLVSGPWGVVSLWGIASCVVVPLTLYRQAFSFSVGYGFSVCIMALSLLAAYAPLNDPLRASSSSSTLLACTAAFYGFRLGSFLAIRIFVNKTKQKEIREFEKTPRLKRIPFAVIVSLFYAFMMTPALYALRAPPAPTGTTVASYIAYSGVATAMCGAFLETIADGHKFLVKQKYGNGINEIFVGPTGGVYRMCRHPNYLGEVVFWAGMLLGGAPSFKKSVQAWICSLLGMYGILGIMRNATSRLDAKQAEKYKNQEAYELWRTKVKAPLVPFLH
jgi:steroid 5-alpha reductase family enzyme